MNIYRDLNRLTAYIDENLENEIDYEKCARMLGVNVYTLQRLWRMLTGLTLSDYIRKRRLSVAGADLLRGALVVDTAVKYNYDNATSFSRAFLKFHGVKPSAVTAETRLKNFPRLTFDENIKVAEELDYEVAEWPELILYGVGRESNNDTIEMDAPEFCAKVERELGRFDYGMLTYDPERSVQGYYCLWEKPPRDGLEKMVLPTSKWLRFRIPSQEAVDIHEMSQRFYAEFLPSARYNLREMPELEHYHDGVTDFLVAVD